VLSPPEIIPIKSILELAGITIRDFLEMKKNFEPVVLKFEIKNTENWTKLKYNVFEMIMMIGNILYGL
jgi:hypothetical protein